MNTENGQSSAPLEPLVGRLQCIFCNKDFSSLSGLKYHSEHCDSHPLMTFKKVAAIVCVDVEVLLEVARDRSLNADELREQIELVHEQMKELQLSEQKRDERYAAASALFSVACR